MMRLRELSDEAGDSDIDVYLTVEDKDIIVKVLRDRAVVCEADPAGEWYRVEDLDLRG